MIINCATPIEGTRLSVQYIEYWLSAKIEKYGAHSCYLPAGGTPRPWYAYVREEHSSLRELKLYQLDEVGNMFSRFFQEELPGFVVHPPSMACPTQADLAVLGIGPNGHVAFHEPWLPPDFEFGEVTLLGETARRLKVPEGTWALTYGLGMLLKTKAALLITNRERYEEVFLPSIEKECDDPLPVAILWKSHPDRSIIVTP